MITCVDLYRLVPAKDEFNTRIARVQQKNCDTDKNGIVFRSIDTSEWDLEGVPYAASNDGPIEGLSVWDVHPARHMQLSVLPDNAQTLKPKDLRKRGLVLFRCYLLRAGTQLTDGFAHAPDGQTNMQAKHHFIFWTGKSLLRLDSPRIEGEFWTADVPGIKDLGWEECEMVCLNTKMASRDQNDKMTARLACFLHESMLIAWEFEEALEIYNLILETQFRFADLSENDAVLVRRLRDALIFFASRTDFAEPACEAYALNKLLANLVKPRSTEKTLN